MYALPTVPLIKLLDQSSPVDQVWYVDDASSVRKIVDFRRWWNNICLEAQPTVIPQMPTSPGSLLKRSITLLPPLPLSE